MVMNEFEKRIREKVFRSDILTAGEWVYLVGLFHVAREYEELLSERAKNPDQQDRNIEGGG